MHIHVWNLKILWNIDTLIELEKDTHKRGYDIKFWSIEVFNMKNLTRRSYFNVEK